MNEDRFYIKDLEQIRGFCQNSDKEDIYKYIYSLQQENQLLKIQVSSREEVANQYIKAVDELMNYIEKNPKILQNPNILDFCIEIKKIKGEIQ